MHLQNRDELNIFEVLLLINESLNFEGLYCILDMK